MFFNEEKFKEGNAKADAHLDPILEKAVASNWTPLFVAGALLASFVLGAFLGAQF